MLPGLLFATWRFFQIFTLIPIIGMLSWFVHGYTQDNQLTPNIILVLFIVSVIAGVWAVSTLLAYGATKYNAAFVAVIDLLIFGALIAGVYYLRGITNSSCSSWGQGNTHDISVNLGIFGSYGASGTSPYSLHLDKNCAMLKASFAFGIMNIIFFFVTFVSFFPIPAFMPHRIRNMTDQSTIAHPSSHPPRAWQYGLLQPHSQPSSLALASSLVTP
jgi:hypothetical protein